VETGRVRVQAELQGYQPLAEERAGLEARIALARGAAAEIQLAYEAVDIQDLTWNRLLTRMLTARPPEVELTRISQQDSEVLLEGLARLHHQPSDYAEALARLGEFTQVTLQSVTALEPPLDPDQPAPDPEAPSQEEGPPIIYAFEILAYLPVPEPPPTQEAAP
jgi:hypothetical protein